jgi:Natural resistance-associated macrophage protein
VPVGSGAYTYLVAANIGAVIMPWMVFYQQSAVIDKGLRPGHLPHARWDTAIGALVTQTVMASVLIAVAAATAIGGTSRSLGSVGDIVAILAPVTGTHQAELLLGLSVMGAAMVAAIVVSLAAAWGDGEVTGYRRPLDHRIADAPWFYGLFGAVVITAAVTVGLVCNLVSLAIAVQVMNALLLPLVLGDALSARPTRAACGTPAPGVACRCDRHRHAGGLGTRRLLSNPWRTRHAVKQGHGPGNDALSSHAAPAGGPGTHALPPVCAGRQSSPPPGSARPSLPGMRIRRNGLARRTGLPGTLVDGGGPSPLSWTRLHMILEPW